MWSIMHEMLSCSSLARFACPVAWLWWDEQDGNATLHSREQNVACGKAGWSEGGSLLVRRAISCIFCHFLPWRTKHWPDLPLFRSCTGGCCHGDLCIHVTYLIQDGACTEPWKIVLGWALIDFLYLPTSRQLKQCYFCKLSQTSWMCW